MAPITRKPRAAAKGGQDSARSVADVTSVLDIPETEFTPKVRAAILALMQEVESLREELRQSKSRVDHLEQLADQDTLAPVANRRAFVREMSRIMAFAQRYGSSSSVIYFDVDGLEAINDTHGHPAGDAALLQIANVLMENIRGSDLVGRLGGDEFGVLLAQADLAAANEKAVSLAAAVADAPFNWDGHDLALSLSYGAYCFENDEDVSAALANADRAMYVNKRQGKAGG
ncbi:MAG: GGDEF domain-containing protein [Alphaproteobacteria bacterium]